LLLFIEQRDGNWEVTVGREKQIAGYIWTRIGEKNGTKKMDHEKIGKSLSYTDLQKKKTGEKLDVEIVEKIT
jgi:hypothetical protein